MDEVENLYSSIPDSSTKIDEGLLKPPTYENTILPPEIGTFNPVSNLTPEAPPEPSDGEGFANLAADIDDEDCIESVAVFYLNNSD